MYRIGRYSIIDEKLQRADREYNIKVGIKLYAITRIQDYTTCD